MKVYGEERIERDESAGAWGVETSFDRPDETAERPRNSSIGTPNGSPTPNFPMP